MEFEEKVEEYRLMLKERLNEITGENWTVNAALEHMSFEYECTLGDFWRVTSNYDIVGIEILKRMDEAIERQAFLLAYHYTEYIQAMETA